MSTAGSHQASGPRRPQGSAAVKVSVPFTPARNIAELLHRCQRRLAHFRGGDAERWLEEVHMAMLNAQESVPPTTAARLDTEKQP